MSSNPPHPLKFSLCNQVISPIWEVSVTSIHPSIHFFFLESIQTNLFKYTYVFQLEYLSLRRSAAPPAGRKQAERWATLRTLTDLLHTIFIRTVWWTTRFASSGSLWHDSFSQVYSERWMVTWLITKTYYVNHQYQIKCKTIKPRIVLQFLNITFINLFK